MGQCAVGPASSNQSMSTYTFSLRAEMVRYARQQGVTQIKVEQICEHSQHNEPGEDPDADEDDEEGDEFGEMDGGGRYLVWAFSTHKTESTVPFDGNSTHTVSFQLPRLPSPPDIRDGTSD